MEPRYKHDCEKCIFLGHYKNSDLYFCPGEPTVIARDGNDGPDYASGLPAAEFMPELKEAKRLAKNKLTELLHFLG